MAKLNRRYIKLSVPEQDITVLKWLQTQGNMSDSIRKLIRDDVERNGYDDVVCREVIPGAKRGRPSNAELEYREHQKEVLGASEQVQEVPVQEYIAPKQEAVTPVPASQPAVQPKPAPAPQPSKYVSDDGDVDVASLFMTN